MNLRPVALPLTLPILVVLSPILIPFLVMQGQERRQDRRLRSRFHKAGIEPDGLMTGDDFQGARCALGWTLSPLEIWSIREGGEPRRGPGEAVFHEPDRLRRREAIVRTIVATSPEGAVDGSNRVLLTIQSVAPDTRARTALGDGRLARFAIPDPETREGRFRTAFKASEILDIPPDEVRRALRRGCAIGESRPALSARIEAAQLAEFGIETDLLPV